MAQVLNLEMRRGDTLTLRGYLRNENGQAVDDATAVYKLAVRTTRSKTGAALIEKTGSQFVAGEGRCTIAPADTAGFTNDRKLYYDMEVTETNGTRTTLLEGTLLVRADVAR